MQPSDLIILGACAGAMAVIALLACSVAAVYRDRGLLLLAAASLLGVLVVWNVPGGLAVPIQSSIHLVLAAAALQLRELVAHMDDRRSTRLLCASAFVSLAAGLLVLAVGAGAAVLGLLGWVVPLILVLRRCWRRCLPWIRTATAGCAALGTGLVLTLGGDESNRWHALLMPICLAHWSCAMYMATVWRHRLQADIHLVEARDRLLAIVGHDLRGPLQTISLAAEALTRRDESADLAARIGRSSVKMRRLISDVMDLSRLQHGMGMGLQMHRIDLGAVAEEVVRDLQACSHDCAFVMSAEAPAAVLADRDRLCQAIENLLSNARQHRSAGTEVQVVLRRHREGVVLEVRNNAPALPDHQLRHLFQPYKRQSVGNPANPGGLGLGLYIAHEIARGHGGKLEYRSEPPFVVFSLHLPIAGDA